MMLPTMARAFVLAALVPAALGTGYNCTKQGCWFQCELTFHCN